MSHAIRWDAMRTATGKPGQKNRIVVVAESWFAARERALVELGAEAGQVDIKPLDPVPFGGIQRAHKSKGAAGV